MTVRVARVSELFESIAADTPASVRERAHALSSTFRDERSALPLAPGDIAGNYEVVEVLGAGGQAVVYKARHRQIGRHVALKVPRREVGDRLLKEAQLAARLEHPSIARVEDIQLDGPVPYMVLEYCERGSLDDLLEQNPQGLDEELVAQIATQVLGALAFAHREGIVHRDVKPANILFDKVGNPKVADFGIGTFAAADGLSVSVELSQVSLLAGTPLYVAPEQENPALRANGRLDGRADLFSFGKVLFQMLTGASPRTIRPPTRVKKGLDPAWDDFVFKLLEERPKDRFPSADAAHAFLPMPSMKRPVTLPAPKVVVQPRAAEAVTPALPAAAPEAFAEATDWQKQARNGLLTFAAIYLAGLWMALGAYFVSHETFIPSLYAGACLLAAGFCGTEARRATRAKSPTGAAILAVALGAGGAFLGSAVGLHIALGFDRDFAVAFTLFVAIPIQAIGFGLCWYGHRLLAPLGERTATRRELALLAAATTAAGIGLGLVLVHFLMDGNNPTATVPIVATISVLATAVVVRLLRLLVQRRWI